MKIGKVHVYYNVPIMPQNAPKQTFLPQICPKKTTQKCLIFCFDTVYFYIKTVCNHSNHPEAFTFIEVVYDKKNVEGLAGARESISG